MITLTVIELYEEENIPPRLKEVSQCSSRELERATEIKQAVYYLCKKFNLVNPYEVSVDNIKLV
jgi:hypothetical protein